MTETELLRRCCECPAEHLAESTLSQFKAYCFGYELHAGLEAENFDSDIFMQAVKRDYNIPGDWPLNLSTAGFLVAVEGPVGALSTYLQYRSRLASPLAEKKTPVATGGIFELLDSQEGIRTRPAMFFGNDAAASHIWSMLSGCCQAEKDSSTESAEVGSFMDKFQDWLEQRFPFSRGIPWHRTFYFLAVNSLERSLQAFFDHYDLFRAGDQAESLSKTARIMLASIADNSTSNPKRIEPIVKRIAPI